MSDQQPQQGEPLIELKDVHFQYKPRDAEERGSTWTPGEDWGFKLVDINLSVRAGERIILAAKNGNGKSTLLKIIGGKRMSSSGTSRCLGRDAFDDTSLTRDVVLVGEPWPADALFSCNVETVVTPTPDKDRRDELARALHIPMKARLNYMSSGQKRRVQILHGLMGEKKVILLDECSTDIDVAERVTLMNFVAKECERIGACCIYATHILDGVESWATRIVMMHEGRIVRDEPFAGALTTSASESVGTAAGALERKITGWFMELSPEAAGIVPENAAAPTTVTKSEQIDALVSAATFTLPADHQEEETITQQQQQQNQGNDDELPRGQIRVENFSFRDLYSNVSFTIPRGKRVLLCTCNAVGKTTLLELLAGNIFFPNKPLQLTVDNRVCFQDSSMHTIITFGGHWWLKAPDGEMHVRDMVKLPLDERAEQLRRLLSVNLDWDVRHVSTGELKRIQLLLKMFVFRPFVLLDEATADLDIHMRANLLRFLYEESRFRGVTVVYSTHIFEGLGEWPTDIYLVDRRIKNVIHSRCVRGRVLLTPGSDDGSASSAAAASAGGGEQQTELLRAFLVRRLCELKARELWQDWYY